MYEHAFVAASTQTGAAERRKRLGRVYALLVALARKKKLLDAGAPTSPTQVLD